MITASITKSRGLEDVVDRYIPGMIEEGKRVISNPGREFSELLKKYKHLMGITNPSSSENYSIFVHDKTVAMVNEVLSPQDIDIFMTATIPYEELNLYSNRGAFFSVLIQNSYNAGHNNFVLHTANLQPVHMFCSFLQGREENLLRVEIHGDVGQSFAHASTLCDIGVYGNIWESCQLPYLGKGKFTIHGKIESPWRIVNGELKEIVGDSGLHDFELPDWSHIKVCPCIGDTE